MLTKPQGSRRGRPSISLQQREDMRARVAAVAKRLFQQDGYGQVSIRRIAAEIGCAPMTLYRYYDGKIDILRTLWSEVFDELFGQMAEAARTAVSPEQRLVGLASAYVGYWLAHPDHYRLVFMTEGVGRQEVDQFVADPALLARFEIFSGAIASACSAPLDPDEVKHRLDALVCFMQGIAHSQITIGGYSWSTADALIVTAVQAVIAPGVGR